MAMPPVASDRGGAAVEHLREHGARDRERDAERHEDRREADPADQNAAQPDACRRAEEQHFGEGRDGQAAPGAASASRWSGACCAGMWMPRPSSRVTGAIADALPRATRKTRSGQIQKIDSTRDIFSVGDKTCSGRP
jgi:hypothetical protein